MFGLLMRTSEWESIQQHCLCEWASVCVCAWICIEISSVLLPASVCCWTWYTGGREFEHGPLLQFDARSFSQRHKKEVTWSHRHFIFFAVVVDANCAAAEKKVAVLNLPCFSSASFFMLVLCSRFSFRWNAAVVPLCVHWWEILNNSRPFFLAL